MHPNVKHTTKWNPLAGRKIKKGLTPPTFHHSIMYFCMKRDCCPILVMALIILLPSLPPEIAHNVTCFTLRLSWPMSWPFTTQCFCFKKMVTIHSSHKVLWIVTVFLKQTLYKWVNSVPIPFWYKLLMDLRSFYKSGGLKVTYFHFCSKNIPNWKHDLILMQLSLFIKKINFFCQFSERYLSKNGPKIV